MKLIEVIKISSVVSSGGGDGKGHLGNLGMVETFWILISMCQN